MLTDEEEKFIPSEATYATVSHGIKNKPFENNGLLFVLVGLNKYFKLVKVMLFCASLLICS